MAKIDHTFTMQATPEQAQAQFVTDIAPELHRKAQLALYKDEPGHLGFSDGIVDPNALNYGETGLDYALLRKVSSHRLAVDFDAELTGTKVTISGRVDARSAEPWSCSGSPGTGPRPGAPRDARVARSRDRGIHDAPVSRIPHEY